MSALSAREAEGGRRDVACMSIRRVARAIQTRLPRFASRLPPSACQVALPLALLISAPQPTSAQTRGTPALAELVDGLGVSMRVLVIAAHPDDEDTRLIA